jgi:zinc transport system permease protein
MKVVGVLLIVALAIIPAAAARALSRTPEQMAIVASMIGIACGVLGLFGSLWLDTPSGPSIVVAAMVIFFASLAVRPLARAFG